MSSTDVPVTEMLVGNKDSEIDLSASTYVAGFAPPAYIPKDNKKQINYILCVIGNSGILGILSIMGRKSNIAAWSCRLLRQI